MGYSSRECGGIVVRFSWGIGGNREPTSERSERVKIPLACVRLRAGGCAYKGDLLGTPVFTGYFINSLWKSHSGITEPLYISSQNTSLSSHLLHARDVLTTHKSWSLQ